MMDRGGWILIGLAVAFELFAVWAYFADPVVTLFRLGLLTLGPVLILAAAFWPGLDNFSRGGVVFAALIWGFLVWGGVHNPQENMQNIAVSAVLPGVLVLTVVVVWFLQRGET